MRMRNTAYLQALLDFMSTEGWVSHEDICRHFGVSREQPRHYLETLVREGKAEKRAEVVDHVASSVRRFIYRATTSADVALADRVLPAYRNLRLSENLVGYERTLHQFQALCMMVRK
jgi:DNA-binding IclR family transcriptional regulator